MDGVWLYITAEIGIKEIFKGTEIGFGIGWTLVPRIVDFKNSLEPKIRNEKRSDRELFLKGKGIWS